MNLHQVVVVLVLACSFSFLSNKVGGALWNLSADDHLELERQLKLLNKPSVATLVTGYGETYDCVEFYKQPAFDHSLLKDYKVDLQFSQLKTNTIDSQPSSKREKSRELKQCPVGTVPIRRITKEDLIRERLSTKTKSLNDAIDNKPGAHYAVRRGLTRLDVGDGINGGGADNIVVYTPQVSGEQYSAGRFKLSIGPDTLEAGWRVDPVLYGDTIPHLYVRIDAGQTHCFDTRCPGFIVANNTVALGMGLESSQRGGAIKLIKLYIAQQPNTRDWIVYFDESQYVLGYWPSALFTPNGKDYLYGATSVEFGGEVYSPPGTPRPPMGAGYIPDGTNPSYDAYFGNPSFLYISQSYPNIYYNKYIINDDNNYFDHVEDFQDSIDYQAIWLEIRSSNQVNDYEGDDKFMIFYGGSGGSP